MPSTTYPSFIIDAFTKTQFAGNPAAVCLIPKVLDDLDYLKIAAEFNLSETAFPLPIGDGNFKDSAEFSLRWFTPKQEYPLCGHATLATAHVLFNEIGNSNEEIKFSTMSGVLTVKRDGERNVEMNFPRYVLKSVKIEESTNQLEDLLPETPAPPFLQDLLTALNLPETPIDHVSYAPKDRLLLVALHPSTTREQLTSIRVDGSRLLQIHNEGFVKGICVTVYPENPKEQGFLDPEGREFDYASRCFFSWSGVNEDPATGSAQCAMAPLWGLVKGKKEFYALQAFPGRGAEFQIRLDGERVILNGSAVTVLRGGMDLDLNLNLD